MSHKCKPINPVSQYRASPLYKAWLKRFSDRTKDICDAYGTLELFFSIDNATGVWLDLIGVIVGQPREVIDSALINYFAFENTDPLTSGFGVGKFWNGEPIVAGNILVDDVTYRKLIKARSVKNGYSTTIEDILNAVFLLTGRTDCNVLDGGLGDSSTVTPDIMQYAIEFDTPIEDDDRVLILALDLLPRPAGVELTTVIP